MRRKCPVCLEVSDSFRRGLCPECRDAIDQLHTELEQYNQEAGRQ